MMMRKLKGMRQMEVVVQTKHVKNTAGPEGPEGPEDPEGPEGTIKSSINIVNAAMSSIVQ